MPSNNTEKKETRGRKPLYTKEEAYARKKAYILGRKKELRDEYKTNYLLELFNTIKKAKSFESIKEHMYKIRIPHKKV